MFGDSLLVAPISTPTDNKTGLAFKQVWLPTAGNASWMNWIDGVAVSSPKTHWNSSEIPIFVRASHGQGAVIPLRTLNSTFTPFVDPLIWVTWNPSVIESAARYTLYEDDGEGLEYEQPSNDTCSTTNVFLDAGSTGHDSIKFVIEPSDGSFKLVMKCHMRRSHLALQKRNTFEN